jgi:hypothetical protein
MGKLTGTHHEILYPNKIKVIEKKNKKKKGQTFEVKRKDCKVHIGSFKIFFEF